MTILITYLIANLLWFILLCFLDLNIGQMIVGTLAMPIILFVFVVRLIREVVEAFYD